MIKCWHNKGFFPSFDEVTELILERFNLAFHIDSVRHYVKRYFSFKTSIEVPFDQNRLACPEQTIDDYFSLLEHNVENANSSFVYNLDEVSFQEYVDSREVTVIVPENFLQKKFSCPMIEIQKDHLPLWKLLLMVKIQNQA
ncbi:hypothetical protein M9Y10_020652 [Tritrichomonas musculus]|uniref:Uncharacterized protein n=1 Tax=Tritrichomonas musculus TaxID=1915356 RepID=A0ABR2HE81_9EUKA